MKDPREPEQQALMQVDMAVASSSGAQTLYRVHARFLRHLSTSELDS